MKEGAAISKTALSLEGCLQIKISDRMKVVAVKGFPCRGSGWRFNLMEVEDWGLGRSEGKAQISGVEVALLKLTEAGSNWRDNHGSCIWWVVWACLYAIYALKKSATVGAAYSRRKSAATKRKL